jgi:hypothetical protein
MGSLCRPLIAEDDGGMVRFRLSPHLHLSDDAQTAGSNGRAAMADKLLIRAYTSAAATAFVRIPGRPTASTS